MVDRLEDAGLVERRADPDDRRARRLHLTAKSREKLARLRERLDTMVDGDADRPVRSAEREEFMRLLTVVRGNLSTRSENRRGRQMAEADPAPRPETAAQGQARDARDQSAEEARAGAGRAR